MKSNLNERPVSTLDPTRGLPSVDLNLSREQVVALSAYAKELAEGKVVLRFVDEDADVIGRIKAAKYTYVDNECCVPNVLEQ